MEPCEHKRQAVRFCGRALVAEDVRTNQILMASLLGKLGLQVTIAGDGREAVQQASSEAFEVIFMDMQMPNMDGYQATKTLREQGITVPIIALTGHTEEEDEAKCLDAGCDDYLSKPIDRMCLVETLGKYLPARDTPSGTDAPAGSHPHRGDPASSERRPSQNAFDNEMGDLHGIPIIDWDVLVSRGFDEALASSVMPICIEDNRKRLQELRSALKAQDVENVRLYAHAIKGSFAMMAVTRLAQVACCLEERAKQGNLSAAEQLVSSMEKGLQTLESLVSKPNWTKIAKEQAKPVIASHGMEPG